MAQMIVNKGVSRSGAQAAVAIVRCVVEIAVQIVMLLMAALAVASSLGVDSRRSGCNSVEHQTGCSGLRQFLSIIVAFGVWLLFFHVLPGLCLTDASLSECALLSC